MQIPIHLLSYQKETSHINELIGECVLKDGVTKNINPLVPPSFMKCINNRTGAKIIAKRSQFLKDTVLEGFEIEE